MMRKKILVLFESFPVKGGAEISNGLLVDYASLNYDVRKVFFRNDLLNMLPVNAALFFKVMFWKSRVAKLVEEEEPEAIITQQHLTVVAHEVVKGTKCKIITFVRDWWFLTPNRKEFEKHVLSEKRGFSKRLIGVCDLTFCMWSGKAIMDTMKSSLVFTVSEYMRRGIKAGIGVNSTVLHPPVEKQFYVSRPASRIKFKNRVILFLGRLKPEKGLHIAIKAMKFLDARLEILGATNGAYTDYCKRIANSTKIAGKVVFLGEVNHNSVIHHIKRSSCVVIPSLWQEPFARTRVEVMATGTPAIVTRRGGMPEGTSPELISEATPEAFAEKINYLLGDFSTYLKFAKISAKSAERYSLEEIGDRFLKILKKELK